MKLDPTALEAAVQAAHVTYIAHCYSMRDAVAAALATIPEPTPADGPQPIDLADLRPGDVFEERHQHRVDAEGNRVYTGITTYHLLDRPDPDAALIEAMAERAARADDALRDGEWPAGFPGADAYRTITRAALAALRETHTIEPKATTGDLRA